MAKWAPITVWAGQFFPFSPDSKQPILLLEALMFFSSSIFPHHYHLLPSRLLSIPPSPSTPVTIVFLWYPGSCFFFEKKNDGFWKQRKHHDYHTSIRECPWTAWAITLSGCWVRLWFSGIKWWWRIAWDLLLQVSFEVLEFAAEETWAWRWELFSSAITRFFIY